MPHRKIPCPSCRTEIEVDSTGELAGEDIGHFSLHETPETPTEAPETPPDGQTPETPTVNPAEPAKTSWDAKLTAALEDE